jgi:hypothetical protein
MTVVELPVPVDELAHADAFCRRNAKGWGGRRTRVVIESMEEKV